MRDGGRWRWGRSRKTACQSIGLELSVESRGETTRLAVWPLLSTAPNQLINIHGAAPAHVSSEAGGIKLQRSSSSLGGGKGGQERGNEHRRQKSAALTIEKNGSKENKRQRKKNGVTPPGLRGAVERVTT